MHGSNNADCSDACRRQRDLRRSRHGRDRGMLIRLESLYCVKLQRELLAARSLGPRCTIRQAHRLHHASPQLYLVITNNPTKPILNMVSQLQRWTWEMILTLQVRPKLPGYPDPARCKPAQPTISSAVAHMVHRPSVKPRRLSSKVYRTHKHRTQATANSAIARECKQDRVYPPDAPL